MPLIEYECQACHKRVEKTISAPAVQFKGGGWYVTDYAKSGATKPAIGDKSDGAKSDSAAESKSESKSGSDAKSEGAPKKESASTPAPSSTPSTSSKSD
jgi:predicted nucleic acid-binding Zn ribbon protein